MGRRKVRCKNKRIDEEILYKAFVGSTNTLVENREIFYREMERRKYG